MTGCRALRGAGVTRTVIRLAICCLAIALLAGGCGNEEQAEAPARRDLTLLTVGESSSDSERVHATLEAYAQSHPDESVQLLTVPTAAEMNKRLASAASGSSAPDIVTADSFSFPGLIQAGQLVAWPAGSVYAADLPQPLRAAYAGDGTLRCAPRDFSPLVLVYSKKLFADAGVAEPTGHWTWEDFRAAADTLTDLEQGEHGLVSPIDLTRWLPFLWQAGGALTDASSSHMTVHSAEGVRALAFFADLYTQLIAVTPADVGTTWAGDALGRGRAAMVFEGPWIVDFMKDSFPDFAYGTAPLPTGAAGPATIAFSSCYALTSHSADAPAAADLAQALVTPDALRTWSAGKSLPPQDAMLAQMRTEQPALKGWVDAVETSHVALFPGDFQALSGAFADAVQDVIDENQTAEEAIAEFASAGDTLLAGKTLEGTPTPRP